MTCFKQRLTKQLGSTRKQIMEIQQNSKKNMVEHKKVRKKDLKFNEI